MSVNRVIVATALVAAAGLAGCQSTQKALGMSKVTPDEFRVEGQLIAVGPLVGDSGFEALVAELEGLGLVYYDDFFELSGNWPEWLRLFAMAAGD